VKYAVIAEHRDFYPVRLMCRVLDVAPSGFYAAQAGRPVSAHARRDQALTARVRAAHAASQKRYGAPRVHAELRAQGEAVGRKRVARLMRAARLVGRRPRRRRPATTVAGVGPGIAPNVLDRQVEVTAVPAINRAWVGDITYLRTRMGWAYLAVLLDVASRRVVGWHVAATLETELALVALRRALATRRPPPGLVHHSDRGVQYASAAYRAAIAEAGAVASMSRPGNCWDNAVAESFFATLDAELRAEADWASPAEAAAAVAEYIVGWYNPRRRHSTLGYCSPIEYELRFRAA
jgi:transposase InsO family protein